MSEPAIYDFAAIRKAIEEAKQAESKEEAKPVYPCYEAWLLEQISDKAAENEAAPSSA